MINMKNNKGVAPIVAVLIVLGVLLILYIILYIPIPQFTAIRYTINYWAIIILFFAVQVGIIYLYYKLISLGTKGFRDIKNTILNLGDRFKKFIRFRLKV